MPTGRITKRSVDALKANATKDTYLWDTDVPGFGVKLTLRGKRTYLYQYRDKTRRTRRVTIGEHGRPWTPEKARREAAELHAQSHLARDGKAPDPAQEKTERRTAETVADAIRLFLAEHVEAKRKGSTGIEYRRLLESHALPALGRTPLHDVTRADIARIHHKMRDTPYQANRMLAVLGSLFTFAIRHGLYEGANPCKHIERFPEKKKERFLSPAELARLGKVLSEHEADRPIIVGAMRLLLLTGARRGEVLGLRWDEIDYEAPCLRLPDSKTGAKTIPLHAPALEVLADMAKLRQEGNPHVFPGQKIGGHLTVLQKVWAEWRAEAGLDDVRIHDFRHTFASVGASGGTSLVILGSILGHADQATTQRYGHLSDNPRQEAAEHIANRIRHQLASEDGEVVAFTKGA